MEKCNHHIFLRKSWLTLLSYQPTRDDRGWFINPLGPNPWWTTIITVVPALLCTILIFMDQQITAVIINRKEHKLKVLSHTDWNQIRSAMRLLGEVHQKGKFANLHIFAPPLFRKAAATTSTCSWLG